MVARMQVLQPVGLRHLLQAVSRNYTETDLTERLGIHEVHLVVTYLYAAVVDGPLVVPFLTFFLLCLNQQA